MTIQLQDLVPDPETLIRLEPEELAGLVLRVVASHTQLHPSYFEDGLFGHDRPFNNQFRSAILQAILEAWAWLEGQALIIPTDTRGPNNYRKASRRGVRLADAGNWQAYKLASLLPKALLHAQIADAIYFDFARGDYSTAVFKAFKEVEVAVRTAGKFSDKDLGVPLMRKAFDKNTGPLTDRDSEEGEREALAHLFAGAIGSYKNPHSHRKVSIDTEQAVEMIMLASHLLRIVDSRPEVFDGEVPPQ